MIEKRQFYINGQWANPVIAHDFDVIDPSTEDVVGVISLGGQADTDTAVAAAKAAFPSWSQTSKAERLAEKIVTQSASWCRNMAFERLY